MFWAVPASKAPLERRRCLFAPDLFFIVSGSSGMLELVKGWHRFDRGRLDVVCPNSAAASLMGGNRGVLAIGPREKDRAIDPMSGRNTSAKEEPDPARAFG